MPIQQPSRVLRIDDNSLFSQFIYGNGEFERVFVRGAISFPAYDPKEGRFHGALSVCASNPDTGSSTLLMLESFDLYDDNFFRLVKLIYEKYKTNEFYYDSRSRDDAIKLITVCSQKIRDGGSHELVYPELIPVSFSSDFQAFSTLLQKVTQKKFLFDGRSTFMIYSVQWDETKPLINAPPEIQAVCVNTYGCDNDVNYYNRKENE